MLEVDSVSKIYFKIYRFEDKYLDCRNISMTLLSGKELFHGVKWQACNFCNSFLRDTFLKYSSTNIAIQYFQHHNSIAAGMDIFEKAKSFLPRSFRDAPR